MLSWDHIHGASQTHRVAFTWSCDAKYLASLSTVWYHRCTLGASTEHTRKAQCLVESYVSLLCPSYLTSHTDPVHEQAPPSVIATWPHPNYVDPVTEGPGLMIVGIVLAAVTLLLVAARIYSRLFITRAPGIDDLLILISLVKKE